MRPHFLSGEHCIYGFKARFAGLGPYFSRLQGI